MRISRQKLQKIRSGQGVWRVWFNYNLNDGVVVPNVQHVQALGKKINYWQRSVVDKQYDRLTQVFACERYRAEPVIFNRHSRHEWTRRYYMPTGTITFVSDAHGQACFTKKKQADRYVQQVMSGQYPALVEETRWQAESDRMFDLAYDHYYGDDSSLDEEPPFDPEPEDGLPNALHS